MMMFSNKIVILIIDIKTIILKIIKKFLINYKILIIININLKRNNKMISIFKII